MVRIFTGLCALFLLTGHAQAQNSALTKTVKGDPGLKSIDAITVGAGVLLIGDGKGNQVIAVKLDSRPTSKWSLTELPNIKDKLAERIGTTGKGIEIRKLAVDRSTGLAYFAVRKLAGKMDLILTMDGDGQIRELPLESVEYARIALPKGDKSPVHTITDISFDGKEVLVAAQASETFASKIIVIPAPLAHDAQGTLFSTETFHVAHNRWETNAPIRTVLPYEEGGKRYLVGAFTCTPIVKYTLNDLQPNARVKGESVIEIGSGNTPQDMFTYEKDGKKYILMSTFRFHHAKRPVGPSPYWTVKVDQSILGTDKVNKEAVRRNEKLDKIAQVVESFHGVTHMDQLDAGRALVVRTDGKDGFTLAVLSLP